MEKRGALGRKPRESLFDAGGQAAPAPPPTMKDVARRAGVAVSSVSRVLSDDPDVSEVMRHRVLDAVAALGYERNVLAAGMRSGATASVGFMATSIGNPIIAAASAGAIRELRTHGYSVLISSSDGQVELDAEYIRNFQLRRTEGILLSLVDETDEAALTALGQYTGRVVAMDRVLPGFINGSAVLYDHAAGMTEAVDHLLTLGHQRLALINGSPNVRPARERANAVRRAIKGSRHATVTVRSGAYDAEHGYRATLQLMKAHARPTAIIVGGNQILQGVMTALRQLRLAMPQDVSLITLDNVPLADFISPSLASVTRDADRMGVEGARLVLDLIRGGEPRVVQLPTKFVPGESCASPPSQ